MQRALARLDHRGPDGHGSCCEAPWAIGHRRLAVIDLAGSAQPLSDGSERLILSYNGELYNYRELRGRLASRRDATRGMSMRRCRVRPSFRTLPWIRAGTPVSLASMM